MSLTFKLSDSIPEPSVSVEALNNELTKMRKSVKIARSFVIRDILRHVSKLRKKVLHLENSKKIERRINRRISDLQQVRRLSVTRLCKQLLANEVELKNLSNHSQKPLSREDQLIIRLGNSKPVANFISSFRTNHEDWQSLVYYLLYKNISGKWKSRTQKRRTNKVCGSLPLPPAPLEPVSTNEESVTSFRIQKEINPITESEVPSQSSDTLNVNDTTHATVCTLHDEEDSDALSDVADAVLDRILQNNQSDSSKKQYTYQSSKCGDGHAVDSSFKLVGKQKLKPRNTVSGETASTIGRFVACTTAKSRSNLSAASSEDNDNPLGDDNKGLQMRRFRRDSMTYKNRCTPMNDRYLKRKPKNSKPKMQSAFRGETKQKVPQTELTKPGMHPSWIAKREQKAQTINISTHPINSSKRIVFDEND